MIEKKICASSPQLKLYLPAFSICFIFVAKPSVFHNGKVLNYFFKNVLSFKIFNCNFPYILFPSLSNKALEQIPATTISCIN